MQSWISNCESVERLVIGLIYIFRRDRERITSTLGGTLDGIVSVEKKKIDGRGGIQSWLDWAQIRSDH